VLQRVVFYRELGLDLGDIAEIEADSDTSDEDHLRHQRELIAMDLAEQLRQHTDHWFHDCGYEIHRGMAEHYRANRRSGRNYDEMAPGLSQYVHDAIVANCDLKS
jgi:hypothetical protein